MSRARDMANLGAQAGSGFDASDLTTGTLGNTVQDNITRLGTVTTGTFEGTIGSSATFPAGGTSPIAYAHIADVKASNGAGGTFSPNAWRIRDLNTEISDADGIVSISSNQFTLIAGTYVINYTAPAYRVGSHVTRLYDVTGSSELVLGSTEYVSNSNNIQTNSIGSFIHSPSSSNTYEIHHRCANQALTYGFGVNSNIANNHYTTVIIYKLK